MSKNYSNAALGGGGSGSGGGAHQISASDLKLETTAEKSIGKEINLVNGKDFNHLDLIIEAKNNRLKSEFFYIYDYEKFNNCSLLKENFDVLLANQINHNSSRYVIHYLTMELKKRFKEITNNKKSTKQEQNMIYDIFKPSLGQFDDEDLQSANDFIRSLFPYEGCSYTGAKLEKIISKSTWINLILSLRIIWSLLPNAIIPWKSYHKFKQYEEKTNYSNKQSFYQILPTSLPTHNHSCILFEFLEILLYIFADNYLLDLNVATDLIFTAGQICFDRSEFKPSKNQNDDDLNELQDFYYKRGYALYQIFITYLRSLSQEPSFTHKTLLETFKINEYPPKPYKPVTQKALTLTVPSDPELSMTNYFKLISNASNATSRIYSSNHTFTKFENKFLDKFEINPHKIIEHFFSKSSKNYLLKFDKNLNFDNFKVGNDINKFRENLKNGTLFENKELISTFINDFSRYGFDKGADPSGTSGLNGAGQNESFVADTINFNFNSQMENIDNNPVRVSKLQISEWFINAWKYETFLGFLQNTVILKLTKTIGDCDWLIITSDDKVSENNRYLTPPSSAEDVIDHGKEKELGNLNDEDKAQDVSKNNGEKSELLPPLNTKQSSSTKKSSPKKSSPKKSSPKKSSPKKSSPKKSSPKKSDLKRISFPSPPKDIAVFENATNPEKAEETSSAPKPIMKTIHKDPEQSSEDHIIKLEQPVEIKKESPNPSSPKVPSLVDAANSPNDNQSFKSAQESKVSTDGKSSIASPPPVEKDVVSPPPITKDVVSPPPITKSEQSIISSPKLQQQSQQQSPSSFQPPSRPRQRIGTPPQQVSRTMNNPPPVLKDDYNTNSLNSTNVGEITAAIPKMFQSPGMAVPKSPVGSPMRFKNGGSGSGPGNVGLGVNSNGGSHPYSQFQHQSPQKKPQGPTNQSQVKPQPIVIPPQFSQPPSQVSQQSTQQYSTPPNKPIEKFESTSPSPHFNFTKPLNSPTSPSTSFQFQQPSSQLQSESSQSNNNKSKRFSKLTSISTKDVQKHFSPSNSPISQALPKFFKKSSNDNLSKMSSSDSSNSLSHINDGSATELSGSTSKNYRRSNLLINNPELNVNTDIIPEIPYTPKAIRESSKFSNSSTSLQSSKEGSSSTINSQPETNTKEPEDSNATDFNKLLSDTRSSFIGDDTANISTNSSKSLPDLVESNEGDDTQDTTKTSNVDNHKAVEQNIDGLLEEIKESLDSNEKFFSTDDLLKNDDKTKEKVTSTN